MVHAYNHKGVIGASLCLTPAIDRLVSLNIYACVALRWQQNLKGKENRDEQ